jgi:hypothetical protein
LVQTRPFWRFLGDEALFILGLVGPLNSMDSTVHSVINYCNNWFLTRWPKSILQDNFEV